MKSRTDAMPLQSGMGELTDSTARVGGSGIVAAVLRWMLGIYAHYREFHSYGPPRLVYMGWVGAAGLISFYFIRFTKPNADPFDDIELRLSALIMFLAIGLGRRWPESWKPYFIPFSYATLLFALPFCTTYNGLNRGGGIPSISNAFIMLCFLTLLVDWRNLIVMLLVGVSTAVAAFRILNPGEPMARDLIAQLPAFLLIAGAGYTFKFSTEQVEKEKQLVAQQKGNERRLAALGDTLGFLAHELNTPLATARGCVSVLKARYTSGGVDQSKERVVQLAQRSPDEIMQVLDRTERAAHYCQTLISRFVQSAKEASPGAVAQRVKASALIGVLLVEYPFEERERPWATSRVEQDFVLNGRRDLMYLVFCTITKNALHALRDVANPRLEIVSSLQKDPSTGRPTWGYVSFSDNGRGVPLEVMAKLAVEPVTTNADNGGSGMGLLFCRRVMESAGGSLHVQSDEGKGTTVVLEFDLSREPV
jgi:signal transduction histidine kinase